MAVVLVIGIMAIEASLPIRAGVAIMAANATCIMATLVSIATVAFVRPCLLL